MKKLTLKLFAGITVLFGVLLCVSVIGCGNSTGETDSGGNNKGEKQEKIDEKEIVINDFWLDETKGSYNKESKILELIGDWTAATLYTDNLDVKGNAVGLEYTILEGDKFNFHIYYNDTEDKTEEIIECSPNASKVFLPVNETKLNASKKINCIRFFCRGDKVKIKINKIYYTDMDVNEIITDNYWLENGKGSFDKNSKHLSITSQYSPLNLLEHTVVDKRKYICIEYENLIGRILLIARHDDGDNNYYRNRKYLGDVQPDEEPNPEDNTGLVSNKQKVFLKLANLQESKKMQVELMCTSKNGAEVTIKKIYFTDEVEEDDKAAVVDNGSTASFNNSISSINLVKDMGVGFNLGNCYEAHNGGKGKAGTNSDADAYLDFDGPGYWSSYKMSKDVINDLGSKFGTDSTGKSNAKTIRIPVTWYNHIIDDKYTIDPYWMENVKKAVDCAYELGYYVIINSHHDTPEIAETIKYHQGYILRDTEEDIAESERFLKAIWEQICTAFNDSYDEHLIFETMNEPFNPDDSHWGVYEGCDLCQKEAELNNRFNQLVLDTIRASGGNNANRFVLIPNVCCNFSSGPDDDPRSVDDISLKENVFKMPNDSAKDKLILTVHVYPMWDHLWREAEDSNGKDKNNDYKKLKDCFEYLNEHFVEKGIPIVIGEIGPTANADPNNTESLAYKLGHQLTAEEVLPPLTDLAKLAGKYGMCILDFHLSDLFLQIDGKYIPEILVDDWKSQ